MITDVMQAVSYLSQRKDVDAKRLAAMGYSMGSFVLGLTCAVETRLAACVLAGGGNLDGEGGYWDSSTKRMWSGRFPIKRCVSCGDTGARCLCRIRARRAWRDAGVERHGRTMWWRRRRAVEKFFDDLRKRVIALHGGGSNVFEFGFEPGAATPCRTS